MQYGDHSAMGLAGPAGDTTAQVKVGQSPEEHTGRQAHQVCGLRVTRRVWIYVGVGVCRCGCVKVWVCEGVGMCRCGCV